VIVQTARSEWDDGVRRLAATQGDPLRYRELSSLVDAVVDELRRRVGQTYTLDELARAYAGAEDWVREIVVRETEPRSRAGLADTALVQDAAFGRYAHGATDYRP
jgi:hypothetical protein